MSLPPGVYADIEENAYHALPGLSSTGIKDLLKSPAHYQHARTHRTEKHAFDLGHAVHGEILGVGMEVVAYPSEHLTPSGNPSTKAATVQWAHEQREAGLLPVSDAQAVAVKAMAAAVRAHPEANELLTGGQSEVSLIWDDPQTGARCRGRLDKWHAGDNVAVDLKTGRTADPREIERVAHQFGWHTQAAHYSNGVQVLTGKRPTFKHVVVESAPPYLVSVIQLDDLYMGIGSVDVRNAINAYAACEASGQWPGYPDGTNYVGPPAWLDSEPETEA